jgi:anthranilate synthase component 2
VLFIENDDSFSWNLVDALPLPREEIRVVSGRDRSEILPALARARAVVLGPGPTDPSRAGLLEYVVRAAEAGTPLLGVCLGHQAIGAAFGASVVRVRPCHGEVDTVHFEESRAFPGCARIQEGMRYHSLALEDVRPPLRVIARSAEGIVMGVEHETLPIAGLQFHPDSYASPQGPKLLAAFFNTYRPGSL